MSSLPQKSGEFWQEQKWLSVAILGSGTGVLHSTSSFVTFKNQLLGGLRLKYSTGPLFHNSVLQISSGLSTFLELRSAGSEADAKWAKNIWRLGFLEHIAFAMRWIFIVRFLGAVDLWTLCGESELAVHIESKKTAIVKVSFEFNSSGMQEMYWSADVIDFKVPLTRGWGPRSFLTFGRPSRALRLNFCQYWT